MSNKAKEVSMSSKQTKEDSVVTIPSGKPARMGNFRLWKSVTAVGKGKNKVSVECINVSNLDGTWLVRIPQTFGMFGMLTVAYQWSQSEDMEERRRGNGFIRTAISNMFYVSSVCNGFFHHGIEMIAAAYANPTLLQDSEEGKNFMQDAKDSVERFLVWRKEYEKHVAENEPTEQELHQEDIAEEAMEILSEDGGTPHGSRKEE